VNEVEGKHQCRNRVPECLRAAPAGLIITRAAGGGPRTATSRELHPLKTWQLDCSP
jgi:hypothetical protein